MARAGSEFFERLSKFSEIRARHDQIFERDAFPVPADREARRRARARARPLRARPLGVDVDGRGHCTGVGALVWTPHGRGP